MKRIFLLSVLCSASLISTSQSYITRKNDKLVVGENGSEIYLRGMCFGNRVWEDVALPIDHHTEIDYQRIKQLGMNTVRFYMNYLTFEEDNNPYEYKLSGWQWLDSNIAWAKKNDLYLILNIHVPQGGFQSMCNGNNLCKNPQNRTRLAALWKAIAKRYVNETQIAGYDLLNEPIPTDSLGQWSDLEQRMVDSIRTVDPHHLIFSEKAIALNCDYTYLNARGNYNLLKDEKVVYSFHFYDPYEYTTQLQDWANTGDGGKYPDETIEEAPSDLTYGTGEFNNTRVTANTDGWQYFKGIPFEVKESKYIIAKPTFYALNLRQGKVYFDDLKVQEVDAQGRVIKDVMSVNIVSERGLHYFSENGDGQMVLENSGPVDGTSISMTGTTGFSSITVYNKIFKVEKGKSYIVNGWMKAENLPEGGAGSLSVDLYYSPSNTIVVSRGGAHLSKVIKAISAYPREGNFPIFVGEFGVVRDAFENEKGGEKWVKDALSIFDSLKFHWTYHVYRERSFGLYDGVSGPVDVSTVNEGLQNVFLEYFSVPTGQKKAGAGTENQGRVFPSPTHDGFFIENPFPSPMEFKVMDVTGKICQVGSIPPRQTTYIGTELNRGFYLIHLDRGEGFTSFKVAKE